MKKSFIVIAAMMLFGMSLTGCSLLPNMDPANNNQGQIQEESDFEKQTREIYNLYVANGGTLTYEEWLQTIKGEKGDKGDKGDKGEQGNPGQQGNPGPQGQPGQNGQDGKDGADGKDGVDGQNGADGQDGKDGQDGLTPYIGQNGHWWIGDQDTGVEAKGEAYGEDGITPHIGDNGNWWIGDQDTGVTAIGKNGKDGIDGQDGKDGSDGLTPFIGENGNWWIGDVDTGVCAQGEIVGIDGEDGLTPYIGQNGNWWIGEQDTGVVAQAKDGKDGLDGQDGADGKDGADGLTPFIGENGHWWIGQLDTGVNAKGDTGEQGTSITSTIINSEGELIISFSDGSQVNAGKLTFTEHVHEYECNFVDATCTTDGYVTFTCKTCGHIETVINKATGHVFDAFREKVHATCTNEGVKSRKCTICGYEETEVIPAHDHVPSENRVYDANKHWHYCTECGIVLDEENHTFFDHTCSACSYTESSSASADGLIFGLNDDGVSYALISYGTCTDTVVDIPSSYNGYPVTSISSGAFQGTNITSVTMPNTIKTIGDRTFYNLQTLNSVCLSANLEIIPDECFYNTRITSVVIPEGVKIIGGSAFSCCYDMKSVSLPSTLENIYSNAFYGCNSLTNIIIPPSVININNSAFSSCSSLSNVVISNGVKTLDNYAFSYCPSLESITIPSSVCYIGGNCFVSCNSLNSIVFEQTNGWYKEGSNETIYSEILSVPELAAKQMKNSNYTIRCKLVAYELRTNGAFKFASIGDSQTIVSSRYPETATSPITYESLDTSIATVDENGVVTAVANGFTQILVKCAGLVNKVDVIVGVEPQYSLNGTNCAGLLHDSGEPYEFEVDGFRWYSRGYAYNTEFNYQPAIYPGYNSEIRNISPISGTSKVVISFFASEQREYCYSNNEVILLGGNNADDISTRIYASQNLVISQETGLFYNGDRPVYEMTLTFDIPENITYFSLVFPNGRTIRDICFY